MTTFTYTALDKSNSYLKGRIEAKNFKKAKTSLEQQGLLIVNLKSEKRYRFVKIDKYLTRVTRLDKIFFTSHLHTLLEAGIPLDQAIQAAAEQTTNQKFKEVLLDIYHNIQRGQSLYSSLAHHQQYFSNFYLSLIKVGETSGKLDSVLSYLLEQQERDYELLIKARGAMIYPCIILGAMLTMVTFMMIFVIPKVTSLLQEYKVDLPLATKILIIVSNILSNFGLILLPLLIILFWLFRRFIRTPQGSWWWDGLLLNLPWLNQIIKEFNLARFARAMSSLLKSGMVIDQALELSSAVVGNARYRKSIQASVGFVQKGISITEVFSGYPKLYPPITSRMIEVGERSGKLDYMLGRLANFYEKTISNTLSNITAIIEPVLLLSIGLGVGFIAIAILTPIWKFSSTI